MAADRQLKERDHAVVIGGGIAGLLAARVLTDHFDQVTLVDRDRFPEGVAPRRGVPQGAHIHGLLIRGEELLSHFFPGLTSALREGGAVAVDLCRDVRWHQFGAYKVSFESGLVGLFQSRPYLEWHIRQRTLSLSNVRCLMHCEAKQLVMSADGSRVTGVRLRDLEEKVDRDLHAGLVVDAAGRSSPSPKWLGQLGYSRPEESIVAADVGYASRTYRRRNEDFKDFKLVMVAAEPPLRTRMAAMAAVEGGRWLVSLAGLLGDHPPADEKGFLEFAQSLPAQDIYDVLKRSEPDSDIHRYKFPFSLWRHYHDLTRFPEGYIILGDALSCFNPIYGQGVTVCALEARALDQSLHHHRRSGFGLQGLAPTFFQRASKVIAAPWKLATCSDFGFSEVKGTKPLGTDVMNWYIRKVHQAGTCDRGVHSELIRVLHLVREPTSLLRPTILFRVLYRSAIRRRSFS